MIKPYESNDLQQCAELLIETYNCPPWNNRWTKETAQKYLQEFAASSRFVGFTLWDNENLIGATFCHEKIWWTRDELYVDEFYISPKHQRKGNGEFLLQTIEDYIKQHFLAGFTLLTDKNMPALDFYKKNKFSHADHVVFMYKEV